MLREALELIAQPTQVDDLGQLGFQSRISEGVRSLSVFFSKIDAGEGMDQVVGDILVLERWKETACDVDVGFYGCTGTPVLIGLSGQHGDVMSNLGQTGGQGGTDKPRPACNRDLHSVVSASSNIEFAPTSMFSWADRTAPWRASLPTARSPVPVDFLIVFNPDRSAHQSQSARPSRSLSDGDRRVDGK